MPRALNIFTIVCKHNAQNRKNNFPSLVESSFLVSRHEQMARSAQGKVENSRG